ncbi:glycosyltransferase family protein [Desulforhopalus singaporensis]|uniref:Predicted glycosyl transferase n=1 Tax=Desulforhopalus singaporensis TaxID=91360 RepID=A0A1H0M7S0_9BACT|nr:glycosyltransferase [Desulforhopalus singaporensis]SDO76266.1 Predicted glycosyl transferase [Desulforhopalus singaporensis]
MKVTYYCQHVLGIGHFYRSLEICRALAAEFPTTLILGGPDVRFDRGAIEVVSLPGLMMDRNFENLAPCTPGRTLDQTKELRQRLLFDYFQQKRPDVFITELYPFGRKAFRFELDPILEGVKNSSLGPCICLSSVRDILVEKKEGQEKYQQKVIDTLNTYFDGVLVHSDRGVIALESSFPRLDEIRCPLHYTGFVAPKVDGVGNKGIRTRQQIGDDAKLIVASIGGGNVGSELLFATVAAFRSLVGRNSGNYHLQVFTGPYCSDEAFDQLKKEQAANIRIDRFTDSFIHWLEAADLSVSMGGYNTCMNLIRTGTPALIYPFDQNREQAVRAARLSETMPFSLLTKDDMETTRFGAKLASQLCKQRSATKINLDGAAQTVRIISNLR